MAKANPIHYCIVPGCEINSLCEERKIGHISFHNFPKDETLKKQWLFNLEIPNFKVRPSSVVCSRHFTRESYQRDMDAFLKDSTVLRYTNKLVKLACPTIIKAIVPSPLVSRKRAITSEECTPVYRKETETVNVGTDVSPIINNKKTHYVTSIKSKACLASPKNSRSIGTQFNCMQYCTRPIGTQTRNVPIKKPKMVDQGTQMDHTHSTTQQFISSQKDEDIFDYEDEEEEIIPPSGCSYTPSQQLEDDKIESRQFEENIDILKDDKFIVFGSALLQLFVFCSRCLLRNSNVTKSFFGSMVIIKTVCPNNHKWEWHSQPKLGRKPAGNVLTSAAILFSGLNPSRAIRVFTLAGIQIFNIRTYNQIQKAFLFRAIKNTWEEEQNEILQLLKNNNLVLGVDGQCDSSSHSAKYGSYCFLETSVKKIIHLVLIQSNQVKNNVAMELEGFKKGLEFLVEKGMQISCLVTDRHIKITAFLKKAYPKIKHLFDCWHIVKSVKSKIAKVCDRKKSMQSLLAWSKSIQNHLYWLASSSGGDGSLMQAKWKSILRHVTNNHEKHGTPFDKCVHGELTLDRERKWLNENSPCYQHLVPIITKFTKDVAKISDMCETSTVESYHSVVIQFVPKHTHFTFHGMEARLLLAALHYNENSQKLQATTKYGTRRWNIVFSKYKGGDFSVKPIMAASSYNYVEKLMQYVLKYAGTETYEEGNYNSSLVLGEAPEALSEKYKHLFKKEALES